MQISDEVWNSETLIPSASTGRRPRVRLPGRSRPATYPLTRTPIPHQLSPVLLPHTTSTLPLPRHFSPVYLTLRPKKKRGDNDYCAARPKRPGPRGRYGYGVLFKGRKCDCRWHDGEIPFHSFHLFPHQWGTSPAESGVDPDPPRKKVTSRPRKVRFAENLIDVFDGIKPQNAVIIGVQPSQDPTTREQDFPEGFPLYEDKKIMTRKRR